MGSQARARELLRKGLGDQARFRDQQLEAILALVDGRGRVLLVQRTGWGKSLVYFIAAALLREQEAGPTILISPLLSLMDDQIRAAGRFGLQVKKITSDNRDEWNEVEAASSEDTVDLLLISPERLANERFQTGALRTIRRGIGMLVVDEAHCISDWGHDFRPDYQRIDRLVKGLPASVPMLASTATANNRVIDDIAKQLGGKLQVIRGELGRESLHLQVVELPSQAERLAWLAEYLPDAPGCGIVYVLTRADAKRVSDWLAHRGIDAPAYLGGLAAEERQELERRLLANEVKALVATVALGMGFDKPDLGFVVHYQRPGSPIAYYQQIGRAGRAIERAEVVLLSGEEDDAIAEYFIAGAFPPEQELRDVLGALEAADELSLSAIERAVNMSRGKVARALKLLEVQGFVSYENGRYARTPTPFELDGERIANVTGQREREQQAMQQFVASEECLMGFIRAELDDPASEGCGRCANCDGPFAPRAPGEQAVIDALFYLQRYSLPIEPRKRWPYRLSGGRPTNIPEAHQLREGRALSIYGEVGWGRLVKGGKYLAGSFHEQLVEAVAEMLTVHWQPDVEPEWVTAIPSLRHPDLVPGFAQRLAEQLRLPYKTALEKIANTNPQKDMENSVHQAENALSSFRAVPEEIAAGPVLLVDDIVDSGWSLTVCGVLLAEAGSGPVVPVALAQASKGGEE
jgi:ATP-dependent DNA helicase RecQ